MNLTEEARDKMLYGFWVYLMTDLLMFATLFAAYAVLRHSTYGGPGGKELFSLPNALIETMILLVSSYTSGLAMLAVHAKKQQRAMTWFAVTFFLGFAFLGLELKEFSAMIAEGNGPQRSAFLSAFFTLVGTHGVHIASGLLWMAVAMIQMKMRGLNSFIVSKLERLSLFWHFLDVVWIFIFTVVYLMSRTA
jgi:cytochrome o ubiquinol oxidase subunit 3